MKLRKSIYKSNTDVHKKFMKCSPKLLKRGDYIRLRFLALNEKRRGGINIRVSSRVVLLYKKKCKRNNLSFIVTSLYKHERVKIRYLISSPYMLKIHFLRKAQKSFAKLFKF